MIHLPGMDPSGEGESGFAQLLREAPDLEIPTLLSLGLGEIAAGRVYDPPLRRCAASYGRMRLASAQADPVSVLWELAGVVSPEGFRAVESLPAETLAAIEAETGATFLANECGKLPELIARFGREHLLTGQPILYSVPGSTLELAAHRSVLASAELYRLARVIRRQVDALRVQRVMVRSLEGDWGEWGVSAVHELPIVPPRTIFNALSDRGLPVEAVGNIGEAFGGSGITRAHPSGSARQTLQMIREPWLAMERGAVIAHLREPGTLVEQARLMESIDDWLCDFVEELEPDDLLLLAGEHGHSPPLPRHEEAPVLVCYDGRTGPLGVRESRVDVAATLAAFFDLPPAEEGGWSQGVPMITFHRPGGFRIP